MRGLDSDDVELEELDGIGGSIVACTDVRPELVRPDHVALLMSMCEAPRVVDELVGDLEVLAHLTNVIDGAIVIFSAALKGDACVYWSTLDNVAAWLTTRRRCSMGSCPPGWSRFGVARPRRTRPHRWI
jgi:hypothetical protein